MVQEVAKGKVEGESEGGGERWRQYVSSLTILCVAIFVGLPLWWKTTEVYRCPLPSSEIHTLSHQQVPPVLMYTISVAVLRNEGEEPALVAKLQRELANHTVRAGEMAVTLTYSVQPLALGGAEREQLRSAAYSDVFGSPDRAVSSSCVAQTLTQSLSDPDGRSAKTSPSLTSLLPPSSLGHYSILVAPGDSPNARSKVIMGGDRWALIHTGTDALSAVSEAVGVVTSIVTGGQLLGRALETAVGRGKGRGREDAEGMRQIRAAQGYELSITLLVPDPSLALVHWNIETATSRVLMPFLRHPGIASLGHFTVSSQVFHYTDVKFTPQPSPSGGYFIPSTSLPPMISSVESKLGSLVSQLPSLHFLVYVAPQAHSPLLIRDPGGQFTDNFLVPQWGGVVFYSPPESMNGSSVRGEGGEVMVGMERVMAVFVRQLQMLLGVPANTQTSGEVVLEPGNLGITEWQVDQLLVAKMLESVSTATTSLVSLVKLLDKVKNMVISDLIQQEVVSSLSSLQECYRLAGLGDLRAAYSHAKAAMSSAETAFFDPSILELLYFPDDQKFAIYIPLFLPISIPIVMSSVAAVRWVTSALRATHTTREKAD